MTVRDREHLRREEDRQAKAKELPCWESRLAYVLRELERGVDSAHKPVCEPKVREALRALGAQWWEQL